MIYKILYIIIIDNANMLQHKYKGIAAGTQPENLLNTVISLTHELGYGDLDSPAIATLNLRRIRAGGEHVQLLRHGSAVQPERAREMAAMLDAFTAEMKANLRGWL
jgi:hypothetical protein